MTDSGFSSNIPPSIRNVTEIPGRGERSSLTGDLIGVPSAARIKAQQTQEAVRLRGEIIQSRDNGRAGTEIRIQTREGEVDVRIPAREGQQNAQNLREGQRVEVDIKIDQKGNSTATILSNAAPPKAQNTSSHQQTEVPAQKNIPITPEALARAKLAEIERNAPAKTISPAQTPDFAKGLPQTGSTIRIEPLSQIQLGNITLPDAALITAQLPAVLTQNLTIAQNLPASALQTAGSTQTQPPLVAFLSESLTAPPALETITTQTTLPQIKGEILSPEKTQIPLSAENIAAPFNLPPALESLKAFLPSPAAEGQQASALTYLTAKVDSILPPVIAADIARAEAQGLMQAVHAATPQNNAALLENLKPGQITATVTGFTERGLPVLQIDSPLLGTSQKFALQNASTENITQGSRLILSPLSQGTGIQQALSTTAAQSSALFTAGTWPVMQEVLQTLAQHSPALATSLANVTPNPAGSTGGAQVSPAAMFFIAAIRSGDFASWLGDKALDILRRDGKGNILSRLGAEMSSLSRFGTEGAGQDWRGISIPMMWQNEVHKATLYYKRDNDGGEDNEKKNGGNTRFIFDLNLSRMGKVQLDGLLRGSKLDLIVRTGQAFSNTMQQEMRRLYTNALEQAQMSGELSFTAKPEKWVTINLEAKQSVSA